MKSKLTTPSKKPSTRQRGAGEATRRRLGREERKQQLVDAGLRVLGRNEQREPTLDEVAAEAGVTKPVLYHYFDNKEAFLQAVAAEEMKLLSHRILHGGEDLSGLAFVESVTKRFFDYLDERPDGFSVMAGESTVSWFGGDEVDELRRVLFSKVTENLRAYLMRSGVRRPVGLELVAHGIIGQFVFAGLYWVETRHCSPDEAARQLAESVWAVVQSVSARGR